MRLALITTDNREDRRDYTSKLPWFGTAVQALLDGFAELPDQIEVHVLSCTRAHLPSPLQLAANITFHSVHVPAWAWLKTAYLGNILAVRRCLASLRPDIVHGQGTERDCSLNAVFSGYPNVITVHGNMRCLAGLSGASTFSFAGLTALLESLALRTCGGVVCLSRHTQNLVSPLAKRNWIIANAVDPAFLAIQPGKSATPPVILIVGDITPNKNQLAFLKAIAPLRAEMEFEVRLFGKCDAAHPHTAKLLDFASHHPWCTIGGFLDRATLRKEMAEASLLALPSLEENLPMVILEAMAASLPVAASSVGGIPDLIVEHSTGMLFDPLQADSIRAAVRHLLEHPQDRQKMTSAARHLAFENHHPVEIGRQHLEVYREALEKS
jgi:glycosyltransferase involved in cell wall biosynthesis